MKSPSPLPGGTLASHTPERSGILMSRLAFTFQQERCVRLAGKLMQAARMIVPGARVGVALSGGMDSWALLKILQIRQRIVHPRRNNR